MATSEQVMPLPRDSHLAAREARAVHTADIHISEPNGTDIWVDVRIGMAKPDCSVPKESTRMEQEKRRGPSNPSTLFDGVVPVIFEQHGCPSPCAITFLYHILRRRVAKLEQSSHLTHGTAWMIASRELCPNLLHLAGDAPPNVSRMQPHHSDAGPASRTPLHGRARHIATWLPRGAMAGCCFLARPGIATQSGFHPRGGRSSLK